MPVSIKRRDSDIEVGCVDPAPLARTCRDANLPTDWLGLANSYTCPRGAEPGFAWLLVRKDDLFGREGSLLGDDEDTPEGDREFYWFDVTFRSQTRQQEGDLLTEEATIQRLMMVDAECVTPGARGDDCVYLLQMADRRYLAARTKSGSFSSRAYNLRHKYTGVAQARSFIVIPGSPSPTVRPWTWDEMVRDLWRTFAQVEPYYNDSVFGDYPGLPWTPEVDPEDLHLGEMFAAEALERALNLLNCTLAYDPVRATFSIAEVGAEDTALDEAMNALDGRRVWDEYLRRMAKAKTPYYVDLMFRRRGAVRGSDFQRRVADSSLGFGPPAVPYTPWNVANPKVTTSPPGGTFEPKHYWPLTYARFYTDMEEDWAGFSGAGRSSEQLARAEELRGRVFGAAEVAADRLRVVYPFAASEPALMPGKRVGWARWAETGAGFGPYAGMTTEIRGGGMVGGRPPVPEDAMIDPFGGVAVLQCASTTADAAGYPAFLVAFFRVGGVFGWQNGGDRATDDGSFRHRLRVVKNAGAPVAGERYIGVYQCRGSPTTAQPDGPSVWAIEVPPP